MVRGGLERLLLQKLLLCDGRGQFLGGRLLLLLLMVMVKVVVVVMMVVAVMVL